MLAVPSCAVAVSVDNDLYVGQPLLLIWVDDDSFGSTMAGVGPIMICVGQ
jgi:hypothetical protein